MPAARPAPAGLALRLGVFGALCAWGAGHWGGFVAAPPTWRLAAVAAVATAGGALLAATRRIPEPGRLAPAARLAIAAGTLALGLVAVGLDARLLLPGNWDELREGLDRGVAGLRTVSWPYAGPDEWLRLTLLLGAPALAALAAVLSFWPARRHAGSARALGLVALLLLYGVPVTERGFGGELGRGAVLALLVLAWVWAPRARGREAAGAALAVGCATLLALPVAARLDRDAPLVDYTSWNWFGAIGGVSFDWSHRYGPLDWPREGTTLLRVRAERPLYWKVETLDRFDGFRWMRSGESDGVPTSAELPLDLVPAFEEELTVSVRDLRSELAVVAGTPLRVEGLGDVRIAADGTTSPTEGPLREGASYTVHAYLPDPSAARLRAAPDAWPDYFRRYLRIDLPRPGETNLRPLPPDPGRRARPQVRTPFRGERPGELDISDRLLRSSPYGGTYALARRLAAGAPTTYDVARRIERHLLTRYAYSERPPEEAYPLEGFLLDGRAGYCQQFSGAMALMLRMNGVPARVAAGFAPGSFDRDRRDFRVRDLDAHSWVEVYFSGIGWVQFDPTPSGAPAQSRARPEAAASAAAGSTDPGRGVAIPARERPAPAAAAPSARAGGGPSAAVLLGALAAAGAAATLALWLAAFVQRRRAGPGGEGALRELARALERLGYPVPPSTTLLLLEARLSRLAGPTAAAYARALREQRFGARAGASPPDGRARRALRRELARRRGLGGRLRGWIALPPFRRA